MGNSYTRRLGHRARPGQLGDRRLIYAKTNHPCRAALGDLPLVGACTGEGTPSGSVKACRSSGRQRRVGTWPEAAEESSAHSLGRLVLRRRPRLAGEAERNLPGAGNRPAADASSGGRRHRSGNLGGRNLCHGGEPKPISSSIGRRVRGGWNWRCRGGTPTRTSSARPPKRRGFV